MFGKSPCCVECDLDYSVVTTRRFPCFACHRAGPLREYVRRAIFFNGEDRKIAVWHRLRTKAGQVAPFVSHLSKETLLMHSPQSESERSRRSFLSTSAAAVTTVVSSAAVKNLVADESKDSGEDATARMVKQLQATLSPKQQAEMCFDWNHQTEEHGILRTHLQANWQINPHAVFSDFYTSDQQELIEAIFWSLYNPEWKQKIQKQLKDDSNGFGKGHSIALFGNPETGPFELVLTGRHLTVRCDGNTTPNVAFGGPMFYGHAANAFDEGPDHPGNVYWSQAVKANQVYGTLDGRQRKLALIKNSPPEEDIEFRLSGEFPGLPVSEMSPDQKEHLQAVVNLLLEPYRKTDRIEALQCLQAQGGLEKCALSFYESDDVGEDGIWDTWRLEGPSFVWHYRGDPHVHVWTNVASDPSVEITTA